MRRPAWLIWLLSLLFVAGYITRLWQPGSLVSRLNPLDIGLAVAIVWWLWQGVPHRLNRWLTLFLSLAVLSQLTGAIMFGWSVNSFLYLVRLLACGIFFAVAAAWPKEARFRWLAWLGVGTSLIGIAQYKLWPTIPLSMVVANGFDPHSGRLFALWFDPNITAALLVITTLATLALYAKDRRLRWLVLVAPQLAAILLTQSRSGLIMLVVGIIVFAFVVWRRLLLLIVAGGCAILFLSPTLASRFSGLVSIDDTVTARLVSWQTGWEVVKLAPVTGVGYNNFGLGAEVAQRYRPQLGSVNLSANGSDSSLVTVWATTGIFGLLSFLIFLFALAWPAQPEKWSQAARRSILLALLVDSLFINSLLMGPVWFLIALAWASDTQQV